MERPSKLRLALVNQRDDRRRRFFRSASAPRPHDPGTTPQLDFSSFTPVLSDLDRFVVVVREKLVGHRNVADPVQEIYAVLLPGWCRRNRRRIDVQDANPRESQGNLSARSPFVDQLTSPATPKPAQAPGACMDWFSSIPVMAGMGGKLP